MAPPKRGNVKQRRDAMASDRHGQAPFIKGDELWATR